MFNHLSTWICKRLGSSYVLTITFVIIVIVNVYAYSQPSDIQLIINTWAGSWTGYISVFICVLLQYSQNKNDKALHLKMDAIITANEKISNNLVKIEDLSLEELENIKN